MKTAAFIFFLFFSINTFAQKDDSVHAKSKLFIRDANEKPLKPIIIVDGEDYTNSLDKIDLNTIFSINFIRDSVTAMGLYGLRAEKGVIVITTKLFESKPKKQSSIRDMATPTPDDILIVVDDIPYNGDISALNPTNIKSIHLLTGASAQGLYGVRGSKGVVIIKMKPHLKVDTLKNK
jgi:TonB-dependent SusC/RagA subfamily outer membrane receptor